MPFFDYECTDCGHKWEAMHSIFYKLQYCPKCDGKNINKLIGTPSMFDLRGDGFYCNDKRR